METSLTLNPLMDNFFGAMPGENGVAGYPVYNIYSEDDINFIELAVTGFSKDELDIYYEDNLLVIEGTLPKEEHANRKYFTKKFPIKNFKRKFKVDRNLEIHSVKYDYAVLTIELRKKEKDIKYFEIE